MFADRPSTASGIRMLHPTRLTSTGATAIILVVAAMGAFSLLVHDGAFPAERADSTADWLAASALAAGLDPHADLRQLAQTLDVEYWEGYVGRDRAVRIPRTPGALVVLYPLSWMTPEQARQLMLLGGLMATAATFLLLWRAEALAWVVVLLGTALAMVSGPARWSQLFVTQSAIVMLCVAAVLVTARRGDFARTGFALAIAGSLKVFPLVLLVLLVARRRYRALAFTFGSLAVLNMTPLLLPHVSMAAMLDAFTLTTQSWIDITPGLPGLLAQRMTLGLPVILLIGAVLLTPAVVLVLRQSLTYAVGAGVLLAAALLALPLSWPHYLLSLVPAFVLMTREAPAKSLAVVLGVGVLLLTPMTPIIVHTLGLLVILVGTTISAIIAGQSQSREGGPATIDHAEMVT